MSSINNDKQPFSMMSCEPSTDGVLQIPINFLPISMMLSVSALLLTVVAASPAAIGFERIEVGTWELLNTDISCQDDSCSYSFALQQDNAFISSCYLTVPSVDPPPDQVHFEDMECNALWPQIRINAAWASNHSIVLCFTDVNRGAYSWFGFDEWEISGSQPAPRKSSIAYTIGDFGN
ncbi:hypothetical protein F5Y15DRAFT_422810 [Xylariaceae sp. FL0016]|nr:hypothetical protein F5Y15DRAFT_422810 [Xylariaceae sp. FL0016]